MKRKDLDAQNNGDGKRRAVNRGNAAARVIQARWRAYESQLSPEEDMISLQRFPMRYAVTLNTKDYNARQLAEGPVTRVPHSRRALTQAELALVQSKVQADDHLLKDRIVAVLKLMQHPALCSESHLRVESGNGGLLVQVRSTARRTFWVTELLRKETVQTAEEAALLVMLKMQEYYKPTDLRVYANLYWTGERWLTWSHPTIPHEEAQQAAAVGAAVPRTVLLNLFDAAWGIAPGELRIGNSGSRRVERVAPGRYEFYDRQSVTELDRRGVLALLQDDSMKSAYFAFEGLHIPE